jgi:Chitobiase/beta-hexosaminidase C-terminal domain/Fn3 associated/Fibronectin type III domain
VDVTQYQLYNCSSSSSEWTQRFNGLVNYDRLGNTFSFLTAPSLGVDGYNHLNGDFAEIIVYGQVLTPAQRDAVNTYLGSKYNLYTAPPLPASLAATPLSARQVSLQWSAPPRSDHVSYLVERSTDGVTFTQVASVADSLSYIDTGLTAASNYTYRVRTHGYAGTSGYSNTATATTLSSGTDLPFTGMRLWLKADAGISAGRGIDLWADQSGNDNNAFQATGSQQPTLVANGPNGRPVVHFDASNSQGMILPNVMNGANAGEIFAVVRSTGTTGTLWRWGGTYGSLYPSSDGTISDGFCSNDWVNMGQPPVDITQYQLYNCSSSSSEWTQRFNGLVNYDRLGNTFSFLTAPSLGVDGYNHLNGDFAEIMVYDHVLSDAERQTVGVYLGNKYGLAVTPQAAPPVFSPGAGTYNNLQSVTITSATNGATIRYTTDGSTPGENYGTIYAGTPVAIGQATTLQAVAYKNGLVDNSATATYTLVTAAPVLSPAPGTYAGTQSVTITSATNGATIRYTTDGRTPSELIGTFYTGTPVAISSSSTLKAIIYEKGFIDSSSAGTYTLQTATPVFSPAAGTYANAQAVTITSATSGATIRYTTDGSAPTATTGNLYSGPLTVSSTTTLTAIAYESGFIDSSVASSAYTIGTPQVAAPVFRSAAGNTVTITSTTPGAAIRYTTDGSTPSETNGTVYSGPVSISPPLTLKAIAYESGFTDSTVTSATIGIPTITIVTPANGSTIGN